MQKIKFYKFQGTGNDFIMIDNRIQNFPKKNAVIKKICDRRFGIGADGVILLENNLDYDFEMIYFNPDGSQSMCGNGGRCAVAFAKFLKIINNDANFLAIDGAHQATISGTDLVRLKMNDVTDIEKGKNFLRLNTGSPHQVEIRKNLDNLDVKLEGSKIRYSFGIEGINANFVEEISENRFKMRTYERGVEDETFSCGTGAVAVAIAMNKLGKTSAETILLETKGGMLEVSFRANKNFFGIKKNYENIWLSGKAEFVFEGEILCDY